MSGRNKEMGKEVKKIIEREKDGAFDMNDLFKYQILSQSLMSGANLNFNTQNTSSMATSILANVLNTAGQLALYNAMNNKGNLLENVKSFFTSPTHKTNPYYKGVDNLNKLRTNLNNRYNDVYGELNTDVGNDVIDRSEKVRFLNEVKKYIRREQRESNRLINRVSDDSISFKITPSTVRGVNITTQDVVNASNPMIVVGETSNTYISTLKHDYYDFIESNNYKETPLYKRFKEVYTKHGLNSPSRILKDFLDQHDIHNLTTPNNDDEYEEYQKSPIKSIYKYSPKNEEAFRIYPPDFTVKNFEKDLENQDDVIGNVQSLLHNKKLKREEESRKRPNNEKLENTMFKTSLNTNESTGIPIKDLIKMRREKEKEDEKQRNINEEQPRISIPTRQQQQQQQQQQQEREAEARRISTYTPENYQRVRSAVEELTRRGENGGLTTAETVRLNNLNDYIRRYNGHMTNINNQTSGDNRIPDRTQNGELPPRQQQRMIDNNILSNTRSPSHTNTMSENTAMQHMNNNQNRANLTNNTLIDTSTSQTIGDSISRQSLPLDNLNTPQPQTIQREINPIESIVNYNIDRDEDL